MFIVRCYCYVSATIVVLRYFFNDQSGVCLELDYGYWTTSDDLYHVNDYII